ncbi:MAG: phosphotransferase [Clostridia bacterium]|nr:phosphotransferase [Clostridia bacterium]
MNFEKVIAERPTKTVYKDNGKTIKLFVENYSKSDILNEAVNQARIEETDLNVPKLIEVKKIEDRWAIILEHIEGVTLESLMKENPEKEDEYLNLFVDTQLNILKQRAPLLGRIKDKMKRKLKNAQNIESNTKYDLLHRLEGMPVEDSVCHGDYNPSNIIIKEDGSVYIIDWAHVTQGSIVFDAARTYLLFNMDGKTELAEKYLELISSKAEISKREILRCVPIVAATQKTKGKEEQQEFLSKWIDVVDYE